MKNIMDRFHLLHLFDSEIPELRSLASGMTASDDDGINCDETEKVNLKIQQTVDSQPVNNAIKRNR